MAESILIAHREELLSAFSTNLETFSAKFVSHRLVEEENTAFSEVWRPSRSSQDLSIELLSAITDSVATDNSRFQIVLNVLKSVLPCENDEGFEWVKEIEERYSDLKLTLPPQLKRPRIGESPPPMCDIPEFEESPEQKIIRTSWPKIVNAVSCCVGRVSDDCFSAGLISGETQSKVLVCSCTNERTMILLTSVLDTIKINRGCFEIFLNVMKEALPLGHQDELVLNMEKEWKSSLGGSTLGNIKFDGLLTGSPQIKVLQKYHAELVTAISGCILELTGQCFSKGLIYPSEQKMILESNEGSEDKARKLLVYVRRTIEADKREALFNIFLNVLEEALPLGTREPLLTNMKDVHDQFKGCSSSSTLNAEATHHQEQSSDIASVVKSLKYSIETITRSENEKCRLEKQLGLKEKENKELEAKLVAMEAERHGNEEEIMKLKLKIRNGESEIVKLQAKIKEQEEIIDRHETKVRREEVVAKEETKVVTDALKEAESVKQVAKEKLQSLENEKSQLKDDFEAQIRDLKGEICALQRHERIFRRRLSDNGLRTSITVCDRLADVFSLGFLSQSDGQSESDRCIHQ